MSMDLLYFCLQHFRANSIFSRCPSKSKTLLWLLWLHSQWYHWGSHPDLAVPLGCLLARVAWLWLKLRLVPCHLLSLSHSSWNRHLLISKSCLLQNVLEVVRDFEQTRIQFTVTINLTTACCHILWRYVWLTSTCSSPPYQCCLPSHLFYFGKKQYEHQSVLLVKKQWNNMTHDTTTSAVSFFCNNRELKQRQRHKTNPVAPHRSGEGGGGATPHTHPQGSSVYRQGF